MAEPWPSTAGDRPPLTVGATGAWRPGTSVLDRGPGRPPTGGAPPPGPVPRGWVIAVAVLSALLLLAVGALVWPRGGEVASTPTTTRPRTTTTAPGAAPGPSVPGAPPGLTPPSTAPAGPPPSEAELRAVVDELVAFVQQRRGLTFNAPPPVTLAEGPVFDAGARDAFERQTAAWERRALVMHVLGVVEPQVDVVAVFRELESAGQVARYDVGSRSISVRAQPITPYTREQLVSALTRALDDQHFGVDRPAYDTALDEIRWAFEGLREGDAVRVADAWVETLPADQRALLERAEQDAHAGVNLTALPPALIELLGFATDSGVAFAGALAAAPAGTLDGAFADPPHATADVYHPDRFLRKVPAMAVPLPAVPGRVLDSGVFGELMTVATLAETVSTAGATRVASGWAGDSYAVYEGQGGGSCIRIAYRASSPQALGELKGAYDEWAARNQGAEVTVEGDTLLVGRCADGGSGASPL